MTKFLLFFFSLPMLGALGHDAYLLYQNPDKGFEFSALGFIWTKYDPESYRMAIDMVSPETWENINYILTFKAFYVGAAITVFFYIIIGLAQLFKGPSKEEKTARAVKNEWNMSKKK